MSVSTPLFKLLGSHPLVRRLVCLARACIVNVPHQEYMPIWNRNIQLSSIKNRVSCFRNIPWCQATYTCILFAPWHITITLCRHWSEFLLSGLPSKFNFNIIGQLSLLPSVSVYWMHSMNALFHTLFCLLCTSTFFLGLIWLLLFHFWGGSSYFACKPALYWKRVM